MASMRLCSPLTRLPHRPNRIAGQEEPHLIVSVRNVAAHLFASAAAPQSLGADRLHVALPYRQAILLCERSAAVALLAFDQQRCSAHENGMPIVAVHGGQAEPSRARRQMPV